MMSSSGIYCFLCLPTGKRYVGQANKLDRRKKKHLHDLRKGVHYNKYLQASFSKYGEEAFEFSVLEEAAPGMLDIREKAWITYYRSNNRLFGFNLTDGGRGCGPRLFSSEHRKKLSRAGKGRIFSEEHRRRLSEANKNKKLTPDHLEKLRAANMGRKRSAAFRRRLSQRNRMRVWTPEMRAKASESARRRHAKKEPENG